MRAASESRRAANSAGGIVDWAAADVARSSPTAAGSARRSERMAGGQGGSGMRRSVMHAALTNDDRPAEAAPPATPPTLVAGFVLPWIARAAHADGPVPAGLRHGAAMYDAMIGNWWVVALRGGAAVLFGLCALLMPGLTLGALVTLFATYALADGLLALLLARHDRAERGPRGFLLDGISGVVIGALCLVWVDITAFMLLLLVGLRSLAAGAVALLATLRLLRTGHLDRLLAATAVGALLFGLVLLVLPSMGIVAVLVWIALSALVVGALLLALGLRLRGTSRAGDGGMMAAA
jgi:uncharacterized membrane protein HdeD (DUF308 family)